MWTRREVLVAAGLIGTFTAALTAAQRLPAPAGRGAALRIGLLQSAPPFVDGDDLGGSRERAFAALMVQLAQSVSAHARLDWLALGNAPLAAAAPLPASARRAFTFEPHSAETAALRTFARRYCLRLTLGAWWREQGARSEPRLLAFERDGMLSTHRLEVVAGGSAASTLCLACARLGLPGAWIEPAADPATAPLASAPLGGGTRLFGVDGRTLASATTQFETCVVGELPD